MIIYTRTSKSKKRKPTAAQRQLAAEWNDIVQKYAPKKPNFKPGIVAWKQPAPHIRETPRIPSLNTFDGVAKKSPAKVYTGDKMLGIATLHKSNAVPVFTAEEAVEISSMRR